MRHRFIAPLLAALASLVLAAVALAGGWAQVTVENAPIDPPAGGETTINLNVLQHGATPVSWPTLTVVAKDAASGAVVEAEAQAEGPEGSYVATIVFPSAGEWTLTFESTDLEMMGSVALDVAPPIAAVQPGAAVPAASTYDAIPLVLLLIAGAVGLALAGALVRSARSSRGKRASVRT